MGRYFSYTLKSIIFSCITALLPIQSYAQHSCSSVLNHMGDGQISFFKRAVINSAHQRKVLGALVRNGIANPKFLPFIYKVKDLNQAELISSFLNQGLRDRRSLEQVFHVKNEFQQDFFSFLIKNKIKDPDYYLITQVIKSDLNLNEIKASVLSGNQRIIQIMLLANKPSVDAHLRSLDQMLNHFSESSFLGLDTATSSFLNRVMRHYKDDDAVREAVYQINNNQSFKLVDSNLMATIVNDSTDDKIRIGVTELFSEGSHDGFVQSQGLRSDFAKTIAAVGIAAILELQKRPDATEIELLGVNIQNNSLGLALRRLGFLKYTTSAIPNYSKVNPNGLFLRLPFYPGIKSEESSLETAKKIKDLLQETDLKPSVYNKHLDQLIYPAQLLVLREFILNSNYLNVYTLELLVQIRNFHQFKAIMILLYQKRQLMHSYESILQISTNLQTRTLEIFTSLGINHVPYFDLILNVANDTPVRIITEFNKRRRYANPSAEFILQMSNTHQFNLVKILLDNKVIRLEEIMPHIISVNTPEKVSAVRLWFNQNPEGVNTEDTLNEFISLIRGS